MPAVDELPEGIVSLDQWLCWRTQERNGKATKVPVNPHTGAFGSATNPDSWGSFEVARAYAIDGAADGLGFVFTDEDPIVGVDLDDCRIPETGTLTGDASAIVETLASYTEVSPSGTGVHVLLKGTLPDGRNRRGSVEMYETARFFTVTGDHVDGTPLSIERRADELVEVYGEYVAPEDDSLSAGESFETGETISGTRSKTGASHDGADSSDGIEQAVASNTSGVGDTTPGESPNLTDTELIERAKAAANGEKFAQLWRGDTSGYESHSEADMALCALLAFWSGGDEQQIDRLFRKSGLMREKWDERHYADGSTYGEKTIDRVLAGTDEFYDPNPDAREDNNREESSDSATPSETDQIDPGAEATILRLREERDELEAREEDHLDLIDALQEQIERLEAKNEQLRAELDELRETTTAEEATAEADAASSGVMRFWQWVAGDDMES